MNATEFVFKERNLHDVCGYCNKPMLSGRVATIFGYACRDCTEKYVPEPEAPDGRPRVAPAPKPRVSLPVDGAARKEIPLARGLLDYFPAALAAVAALSKKGNDQHNPGEEMHHARGKSGDHADCIMRHLVDRGTVDTDGVRHSAKVAWRALALLQQELEDAEGAPLPRGAKL